MPKRETKLSFEAGIGQLEQLVGQLETGSMPLDESFKAYERAMELLKALETELNDNEARIMQLTKTEDEVPLDGGE